MAQQSDRLILKDPKAKSSVHQLGYRELWLLKARIQADSEKSIPFELIWETPDGATTIHYIEDLLVKFPYLVVKGKDVEKVVSRIQSSLNIYSEEEIMRMIENAKTVEEKVKAVALLGVAAPQQFNQQIFNLLQHALTDPDSEVRRTAVWATGYSAWSQFRKLLEKVLASDPDQAVRQDASFVLAGFNSQASH